MKNKTCNQIYKISKALLVVFIVFGSLGFALLTTKFVFSFLDSEIGNDYVSLALGIVVLFLGIFLGIVVNGLCNGFGLLLENSVRLSNKAITNEKANNEIKSLLEQILEKGTVSNTKEEKKEDLSSIKKTTKPAKETVELKELKKEVKAVKEEKVAPVTKSQSAESIKEKLAKAKGEVQKTMAVRSQVAANTITSTMIDDIHDKSSVIEFETPEQYSQIESELFKECINLEKIEITENIKLIGANAFTGCEALTTVVIGKGVGVIEKGAFEGCPGLDKVIYKGSQKQWEDIVIQSGNEILKRIDIVFEE